MTHLAIHAHWPTASLRTPGQVTVAPRAAAAFLALLAAIAMVRGFEIVLNPAAPVSGASTPAQSSPVAIPGFDS